MSDMKKVGVRVGLGEKPVRDGSFKDVEQLVKARKEALEQKQMARRAAWQEQVKAELAKRAEYKRQMEGSTRKQITDWKDKVTLSKISEKWRKTFRSERAQFLFNETLPIISQYRITRWNITFQQILGCRLVSKEWKDAIDSSLSISFAHNHEFYSRASGDSHCLEHEDRCNIRFDSMKELKSFNLKSDREYRGMNPFPFRKLYIGSLLTGDKGVVLGPQYWIEMTKLLQRWGKEIWMAKFVFEDGSIEMMYELLIKYLSLMPNLQELSILERDRSPKIGACRLRIVGIDVHAPLKLRMKRKPLPELPHLRSIYFYNSCPAPLIEAALVKYRDIESFEIPGFDDYSDVDLGKLVARKKLLFTTYCCEYSISRRITNWNYRFPALQELSLNYSQTDEGPEVANIFKTVNSCGSTIRRLRLRFHFRVPDWKLGRDWRDLLPAGMKLELPHLELLDLGVERSKITDVDFLLPLACLKEMTFYYHTMGSDASAKDRSGILQFAEYRDRLYDSNIWKLLPEIKLVTINTVPFVGIPEWYTAKPATTPYSRDGYRQYQHGSEQHKMIMSDMLEAQVNLEDGAGEKPTREENSDPVLAQLVKVRQEALKQKQMARRAAWQVEVKAELEKRAKPKRQIKGILRNQNSEEKDRQTLSKISMYARKTFRSERTQFLFNEVFPILTRRNDIFPEVLLTCRLVSKIWKDVIDSSVSSTSEHLHEICGQPQPRRMWLNMFSSVNELKSFNEKSEQEHRSLNPFPFHQLYIGHPLTSSEEFFRLGWNYWIEMTTLLQRWGKMIWTAIYKFDNGSIEMMYEYLVKYLSLMPNLRELVILERDRSGNLEAEMLRRLGKDVYGPLKLRMERKPLPELRHLHSVSLGNLTPAPLVEAVLVKYGDALQTVKVEGAGFDKYSGEYVDLGEFVAGRELPLKKYFCEYKDASRITDWSFQFSVLNELRLDYLNVKEDAEVANVFKTVNSVGSTIRRLRLTIMFDVPDPKGKDEWRDLMPRDVKLELPHLEWFDLTVERSKITNFDFLLPLVSLKELDLYYFTTMSSSVASVKDGQGIIQFVGYGDRLYDSNIWTLLPELKLVRVNSIPISGPTVNYLRWREPDLLGVIKMTTTVHTREGYRHHQKGF